MSQQTTTRSIVRHISGAASQVIYSGGNIFIGIYSAAIFSVEEVAHVAFIMSITLFFPTILNSLSITPMTLKISSLENISRKVNIANKYYTISAAGILALSTLSLFVYLSLLPSSMVFPSVLFTLSNMLRHEQRMSLLAEGKGSSSLFAECLGFAGIFVSALITYFAKLGVDLFVLIVSLSLVPAIATGLVREHLGGRRILLHRVVVIEWARTWRRSGRWSLPGVFLSDLLQSGHVYILTALGSGFVVSHIYVVSLLYRPVTVLLVALNVVLRPIYVRSLKAGRHLELNRYVNYISLALCVIVVLIGVVGYIFLPKILTLRSDDIYNVDYARVALLGVSAFYLAQSVRMPINTVLQAAWDFRNNLMIVISSCIVYIVSFSASIYFIPIEYSILLTMMLSQITFSTLVFMRYKTVLKKSSRP